jgi:lipid II:glycine glycyltransferase (peptidoglycan interpeptide bridge formation enzyme)
MTAQAKAHTGAEARPKLVCRLSAELSAEDAARFDAFTGSGPHASYMQKTSWVGLSPSRRLREFLYLTCEEAGEIRVAGLARLTPLYRGRYLAKFQRGPVFNEIEHFDGALPLLLSGLREAGACTVMMNPRWEDEGAASVEKVLAAHGMRELSRRDQSMYSSTGIVDLDRPEEEIFADFERRCRKDIRRGVKKGVRVRPAANQEEARLVRGRREELVAIRKFEDFGQPDLVDQWRSFQKNEDGVLLLAEAEGQVLAGLAVAMEGERAVARGGGAPPILPAVPRLHNLIWESMRIFRNKGCTAYDLAGVNDESESDSRALKRDFFKQAFNPRVVRLVPIYCAALRPLDHALFYNAWRWYRRTPLKKIVGGLLRRAWR